MGGLISITGTARINDSPNNTKYYLLLGGSFYLAVPVLIVPLYPPLDLVDTECPSH